MTKSIPTLGFAATLLIVLQTTTALAQETQPQAVNDTANAAGSGDIIVTAQRRSETLERTPVAVAVLGAETLAKQAIVSQSDLQSTVPGLTVKAGQSSNQLNYSLRGQTVDSFSSSRPSVLPYFNEVQVGGGASSAFYDLQSVQVLKGPQGTLFGRNSTGGAVLFTSAKPTNEFGGYASIRGGDYKHIQVEGAINVPLIDDKVLLRVAGFFQRRDGFQYNLFDGGRLGDVRRENIRASLTLKPSDNITNDLVIDYAHSGGNNTSSVIYNILPISANKPGNPFVPSNFLYSPAVDAAFGPGAFARFLALHPRADPDGIVAFTAKQQARGPFLIDVDAPNFHRSKTLFVSNITTLDIGENTQIKNIIGYVNDKSKDAGEFDGTSFPSDDNGKEGRGGTLTQFSEELQLIGKAFNNNLSYVAGLYFSDEKNDVDSLSALFDLSPTAPVTIQLNNGITTNKTYAAYGQGTLDLSDIVGIEGLGFTAGARYSSEKVTFLHKSNDFFVTNPNPAFVNPLSDTFNKFSWQLGLQQQVNSNLLLYAVTRRSFRSGGFNFFAPPLPGFGNQGGAEYDAERATDIELGLKLRSTVGEVPIRLNIAAYTMTIDKVQRSNYVSIFGSLAGITVNVPKAKVSGFEVDGVVNPTDWLSFGGSVNYTHARFTDNLVSVLGNPTVAFETYPDTPEWSGSAFGEIAAPISAAMRASLRADVYSQTSTYFSSTGTTLNPGTQITGYTIANFRLGVEDQDAGWSLSANLKNAFNRTYYVGGIGFSSLFALNSVIPGDPRTFLVEARYKF